MPTKAPAAKKAARSKSAAKKSTSTSRASKRKGAGGASAETSPASAIVPTSYTITFGQISQKFFASSLNKAVRDWTGTEQQLVAATLKLCPHFKLDTLLHQGLQEICKKQLATAMSESASQAPSGIAGQADARLDAAVKRILEDNKRRKAEGKPERKLTPNIVGDEAEPKVGYRTAKRYLKLRGLLSESNDSAVTS